MAIRGTYKPVARRTEKAVTLFPHQLAKFIAVQHEGKVKTKVIVAAMDLLRDGIIEALAQGFNVSWPGLLSAEVRVVKERERWDGLKKAYFSSPASVRVHIKTSPNLTQKVVDASEKFASEQEIHHLSAKD